MLKTSPQKWVHQLSSFRMALGSLIIKEKLGTISARNSRTNPRKPLSAILYRSINYKHIKAKFPKKTITRRNLAIIDYLVVTGGKTILPKQKNKSDSKTTPIYQKKLSSY